MKKKILLIPILIFILFISVSKNNVKINRKIYKEGNEANIYKEWLTNYEESEDFVSVIKEDDGYIALGTGKKFLNLKKVVKYDFNGNMVWQKDLQETNIVLKSAIKVQGGYLIVGEENGATIIKYDNNWDFLWKSKIGNYSEFYNSVIETSNGYVVAGRTDSAIVVKYNTNGEEEWRFNSFDNSFQFDAIVETEDGYVVVGNCRTNNFEDYGYMNAKILKIDKNGNYLWSNEWGGKGGEVFEFVSNDSDGYMAIGESYETTYNGNYISSDDGMGIAIVKYDKYGEMLWYKVLNSGDDNNRYYFRSAIKVDNDYVVNSHQYYDRLLLNFDKSGNLKWKKKIINFTKDDNSFIKAEDGYIIVGSDSQTSGSFITKYSSKLKIENNTENADNDGKTYKKYNIGDTIKYRGEDYYIIDEDSSSNNYLTLLKSEPLTNDDLDKFASGIKFEKGEKYGLVPYFSSSTCNSKDNESGCKNRYEDSDVKKILDNWANEFNGDLVKVDGYKVRLLKYYNAGSASTDDGTCIHTVDVPNWLYNNYYTYWLMNTIDDKEKSVIAFGNDSTMCTQEVYKAKAVRPVINLKKCVIEDNCPVDEPEEKIEKKESEKPIIETKVEPEKEKTIIEAENTFKTVSYIVIIIGSLLIISGYIFYKRIKKEVK